MYYHMYNIKAHTKTNTALSTFKGQKHIAHWKNVEDLDAEKQFLKELSLKEYTRHRNLEKVLKQRSEVWDCCKNICAYY